MDKQSNIPLLFILLFEYLVPNTVFLWDHLIILVCVLMDSIPQQEVIMFIVKENMIMDNVTHVKHVNQEDTDQVVIQPILVRVKYVPKEAIKLLDYITVHGQQDVLLVNHVIQDFTDKDVDLIHLVFVFHVPILHIKRQPHNGIQLVILVNHVKSDFNVIIVVDRLVENVLNVHQHNSKTQ